MPAATMHIDVGAILHASVNGVYTDLVTRATGRTVRTRIEEHLAGFAPGTLSVIDFTHVGLLDFSCADEVVATLMRQCCADENASGRYLLFTGITDDHLDAIEQVLERHHLALIVRATGISGSRLVGVVDETERNVWDAVTALHTTSATDISEHTGIDADRVSASLATLHRRRLIVKEGAHYRTPFGQLA